MKITKEIANNVLNVIDAGLVSGRGDPVLGSMCMESAITYAMHEPFSDSQIGRAHV